MYGTPRIDPGGQRRADLRHLHERQRALLMRAPPEQRHDDRGARVSSARSQPRVIFSPTTDAHAAADERVFHRRHDGGDTLELAAADDDSVEQTGGLRRRGQTLAIAFRVGELERIERSQTRIMLGPPLPVEERLQAVAGGHPEMVRTVRTDLQRRHELLVVDDAAAGQALDPEPLRDPARRLGRLDRLARLLEPRHGGMSVVPFAIGYLSSAICSQVTGKWLLRSRHVVPRSGVMPDCLKRSSTGVVPRQVDLRRLHDQQRCRRVVKEVMVVRLD